MKLLKLSILSIAFLGLTLSPTLLLSLVFVSPTMSQEVLRSIAPKFTPDPQVYSGKTGGDQPLQSIATSKVNGQCQGLADQTPNHTLRLEKDFGQLSVKVAGDRELSLLVKGPDGIYCRSGNNPELSGAWVSGQYEIWVGIENGDLTTYRLSISETSQ